MSSKQGTLLKTLSAIRQKNAVLNERKKRFRESGLSWVYIKYLKHIKPDKIRYHSLKGKKIAFMKGPELIHALQEIFVEETYLQVLPENARIIDCGANIGISVIYLNLLSPSAHITAFEPDDTNFSLLEKNAAAWGIQHISLRKEAVWIKNETLFFENNGSQDSKITGERKENTVEVKGTRLRDELNGKVDFLKIDIEGAEYVVIKDIADKLHLVDNLFIEYHGMFGQVNELVEILDIVTKSGFTFYIKEASNIYPTPFLIRKKAYLHDMQLNIFCMRNK